MTVFHHIRRHGIMNLAKSPAREDPLHQSLEPQETDPASSFDKLGVTACHPIIASAILVTISPRLMT